MLFRRLYPLWVGLGLGFSLSLFLLFQNQCMPPGHLPCCTVREPFSWGPLRVQSYFVPAGGPSMSPLVSAPRGPFVLGHMSAGSSAWQDRPTFGCIIMSGCVRCCQHQGMGNNLCTQSISPVGVLIFWGSWSPLGCTWGLAQGSYCTASFSVRSSRNIASGHLRPLSRLAPWAQ